jgi:hypothetical protein
LREVGYLPELLRLLANAEQPLYSAYVFARENAERVLPLDDFLQQVDSLVAEGVLNLWLVSQPIRARLARVPEGLGRLYENEELDGTYDPFGLSIENGHEASLDVSLDWEADIDFVAGRFRIQSTTGDLEKLLDMIAAASGTRLIPETRDAGPAGSLLVEGSVESVEPGPV